MAEFTLKRREVKTMSIHIDDKTYHLPLAGSLPPKKVASLDTAEKTLDFIKEYIPANVVDSLTQDEYTDLVQAWGEASKEASGLKQGE